MLIPLILAITPLPVLQADAKANAGLLDRIQAVETGGHKHPDRAVGDAGKALGYFQMHQDFYADARAECHALPDYRTACASREWSRLAVCAYWRRYAAKGDKDKALRFHYGPSVKARQADRHNYYTLTLTKGR
jgi:hypothetical protein